MKHFCSEEYFRFGKAAAKFAKLNDWKVSSKDIFVDAIDKDMIPLVDAFIDRPDITTMYCCEGHFQHIKYEDEYEEYTMARIYIVFAVRSESAVQLLMDMYSEIISDLKEYDLDQIQTKLTFSQLYGKGTESENIICFESVCTNEEIRQAALHSLYTRAFGALQFY